MTHSPTNLVRRLPHCGLLDRLAPTRQFARRSRPSDPWFGRECRNGKRLTSRRLIRIHAVAGVHTADTCRLSVPLVDFLRKHQLQPHASVETARHDQRRRYGELLDRKRTISYWQSKTEVDRDHQNDCGYRSALGSGR